MHLTQSAVRRLADGSRTSAAAALHRPALAANVSTAYAVSEQLSLSPAEEQRFHTLYCEHFDFVFRNLRRLGVPNASLDDALQDVYMVVLRRISELPQDAHHKAWIFAILYRVASNHRRSQRRRGRPESLAELPLASPQPGPFELTARAQAAQLLHGFLDTLDHDRRAA